MKNSPTYTDILREQTSNLPHFLRLPEVKRITGYSRSAIYLKIAQGIFPKPIALGARAVGWLEVEVADWIEQRVKTSRPDLNS